MPSVILPPAVPIGKIKTFGTFGPKYEVGEPVGRQADGEWVIRVTLVETGEKAEYPYAQLINDPDAE